MTVSLSIARFGFGCFFWQKMQKLHCSIGFDFQKTAKMAVSELFV